MNNNYDRTKTFPYSTVERENVDGYYRREGDCKICYLGKVLPGEQWRKRERAATVVDMLNEAYERGMDRVLSTIPERRWELANS